MYCSKCGANVPDNSKFCMNCGNPVSQQVANNKGVYFIPGQSIQQPTTTQTAKSVVTPQTQSVIDFNSFKPKSGKQYSAKNYYFSRISAAEPKETAFVFISPFDLNNTFALIKDVMSVLGKVKSENIMQGYIDSRYVISFMQSVKVEFYLTQDNDSCRVRAIMKDTNPPTRKDYWWDCFLRLMFSKAKRNDFGVTLCDANPYIVGVKYIGSDTTIATQSVTRGGTSLLGFLAGDALFGTAGAIVGGMSGTKRTNGISKEIFSKTQLVRLVFNNGRIYEGEVKKNSKLYNQIMAQIGY